LNDLVLFIYIYLVFFTVRGKPAITSLFYESQIDRFLFNFVAPSIVLQPDKKGVCNT